MSTRSTPTALTKARYSAVAALAAAGFVTGGVYVHVDHEAATAESVSSTTSDVGDATTSGSDGSTSTGSSSDDGTTGDALGSSSGSAQTTTQGS